MTLDIIVFLIFCIIYFAVMAFLLYKISTAREHIFYLLYDKFEYPEVISKNNVYSVSDNIINYMKDIKLNKYERDILEYYFDNKDYTIVIASIESLKTMKKNKGVV